MGKHPFQFGDQSNADVKLHIICSKGFEYEGNPLYLHSQVLNKSKFLEAMLSERWSSDTPSSLPEIKLTIGPNCLAENYIKCIRFMYLSTSATDLHLSDVDETLDILPVASELLFEDGIQACLEYLEAVAWTTQQKSRIRALLSLLQVSISTDLAERLAGMSESSFREELKLLKKRLPQMLSEILDLVSDPCALPLADKKNTIKEYIVAKFQPNIHPAIQDICGDALLNEFQMKIDDIKYKTSMEKRDTACGALLWLLDLINLCKREIFEVALKMFVEDGEVADILIMPQITWVALNQSHFIPARPHSVSDSSCSGRLLEILVCRFLKALAYGNIICPKSFRISFLRMWIPVMAYLICWYSYVRGSYTLCGSSLEYSKIFEVGVTKVMVSLPINDQKQIFKFWADASEKFQTWEKGAFQWWINVIWLGAMNADGSHLQIE